MASPVSVVRPFNTYGPRQSTRALIATVIAQALRGDVVKVGNLTPTRDFLFVTDTARAFLMAAGSDKTIGEEVNFGTGVEIGVPALVERVGSLLGKTLRIEQDDTRTRPATSEVFRLVCDSGKARELLGWAPRVALDEGLRATIDWIERSPEGYERWQTFRY